MEQQSVTITYGYCHCGCGRKTSFATRTNNKWGYKKGEPVHFIVGHRKRLIGENHPNWKGGRVGGEGEYIRIARPDHPHATFDGGYILEHVAIAEIALGKFLPLGAIVHHVNENPTDNRPENLVICENQKYHMLLHARLRALKACGNPNFRRCSVCHQWNDPNKMYLYPNGRSAYHRKCGAAYARQYRAVVKARVPAPPLAVSAIQES